MSFRPLAWITGAGGLIGNCLVQTAPHFAPGWQVCGLTRVELDLLDFDAVRQAFNRQQPQLVIHCAAMSKTPECQARPKEAYRANAEVTALLAELAAEFPLVFFSTDLVFDGREGGYREASPVNPLCVYGETKAAAERIVLANPRHLVIRTSLNAGASPAGNRTFNELMRQAWQRGEKVRLFADEFRSPIHASVTARAVWELVARRATGIVHVAGSERLSRLVIGQLLAARWPELNPQIEVASIRDHPAPPRAPDTSLNCEKARKLLSFRLPAFGEWLRDHPEELV
jgi:dTDP-4-dehydrorhamnose reductase